ncbi:MAG TPA: hypothetical protein VEG34_06565 [Thermoanaerobaculia bacterium]|nr:hypothetical protein [Thermoanaerobaculia bacterium]
MDMQGDPPGGDPAEDPELQAYCAVRYAPEALARGTAFPLPDEAFVPVWEEWARQSAGRGAFAVLSEQLPQLRFPVRSGISQEPGYRAATLRGVPPGEIPEATGLELERPESLELAIHASPAGRIPLIVVRHRPDFATVLRALARRNEPAPVPDAQGALMVAGYNSWPRLHALRRAWEARPPLQPLQTDEREAPATTTWGEELKRLQATPELFQDRFVLLSDGPYSAVPALDLGLGEQAWRETSLALRRDHECAHYLTRRLFGAMRNHLLDELVADYAGMTGAAGRYRADWQRRFLGLETGPRGEGYRSGGRLDLYRGDPPLSDGAFERLQALAGAAAAEIERFDAGLRKTGPASPAGEESARDRALVLLALATLRVDEIAAPGGAERLAQRLAELRERI